MIPYGETKYIIIPKLQYITKVGEFDPPHKPFAQGDGQKNKRKNIFKKTFQKKTIIVWASMEWCKG